MNEIEYAYLLGKEEGFTKTAELEHSVPYYEQRAENVGLGTFGGLTAGAITGAGLGAYLDHAKNVAGTHANKALTYANKVPGLMTGLKKLKGWTGLGKGFLPLAGGALGAAALGYIGNKLGQTYDDAYNTNR